MIGIDLVHPLDEGWREVLDAVGRARGWPTSREVSKLAGRVADLSAAYNDPGRARSCASEGGAGRLAFSFPRDVPKGAAAVRELLATGALPRDGELRVLDIGAGLGAMTWGLSRAREALGGAGSIDATWVDADADALALAGEVLRERTRQSTRPASLRVRSVKAAVGAAPGSRVPVEGAPFDAVLLGNVLSEMDVGGEPVARAEAHAAWLTRLVSEHVAPGGSLVVVEPALRDRTRHLHRVRNAVLAAGGAGVFAPCTHAAGCPALADERDWCHEDLRLDLPPWLVPVARAAGLRYEGLTFSYLVLRRDGRTLAASAPDADALLRVVSDRMKTKGKLEFFLCGEFLEQGGGRVVARARTTRLDRDAATSNAPWETMARGDVVALGPAAPLARPRLGADSRVRALG